MNDVSAQLDSVRFGSVRFGLVHCSAVRCSTVRGGTALVLRKQQFHILLFKICATPRVTAILNSHNVVLPFKYF